LSSRVWSVRRWGSGSADIIEQKLRPWSEQVRDLPAGWLIPIGILILISFPPLFGHEIVALLCGVVWGLWIGFGIVAAGTFFGESKRNPTPALASSALLTPRSRHLVCLQVRFPEKGPEIGADQPELRRAGPDHPRRRILGESLSWHPLNP